MKEIGGYFELELNSRPEYHSDAIRLNTGRNALEYILRAKQVRKLYLPYFTCDVIFQPVTRLGLEYEFYAINELLEPRFEFERIRNGEAFLYTNYFGQKDAYIRRLAGVCKNLVVDNAQGFFMHPPPGVDTFYSARKFFGLPDGAYLYTDKQLDAALDQDVSFERFDHLLRRIDVSAGDGYPLFVKADKALDNLPILKMSSLTARLLSSIDYERIAAARRENFQYLHSILKSSNQLPFELAGNEAPLTYPLLTPNEKLRETLRENKIFTAQYWPNVADWVERNSLEHKLARYVVHLPIDQRMTRATLDRILTVIAH